jgi:chemotaxis protein MotB
MAKGKCPECEEGAPGWLVSFADMTTLLLCFFIFLLVTAKVDVDKLHAARGFMAYKMGILPENQATSKKNKTDPEDEGKKGEENTTTSIEDGKKLIIGGKQMFKKGSAVPDPNGGFEKELLGFARDIKGYNNVVEVRGHTGRAELDEDTMFEDNMALSIARARAISNYLVKSGRIREWRIRIVGCGANEPLESSFWIAKEEKNRRVEIRITQKTIEFNPNTDI